MLELGLQGGAGNRQEDEEKESFPEREKHNNPSDRTKLSDMREKNTC